jgi:hypothetical protein
MNLELIQSFVRAGMQALAGYFVTKGLADQSIVEPLTGIGLSGAALIWSWLTHKKSA